MGLFVCMECGCVENTNCCNPKNGEKAGDNGFPNLHTMEMHGFDQAWEDSAEYTYGEIDNRIRSKTRMLCSECNTGKWHDEWEKTWPTPIELRISKDCEDATFTSHPLFKNSYDDSMLHYTVEEFEEDLRKYRIREIQSKRVSQSVKNATHDMNWMYGSHEPFIRTEAKIGRNDICHCGSGKKYKKCCQIKKGS